MNKFKLSIITLSFNQSEYLKDNLESVSKFLTKNVEHIIIDPGSTDNSRQIIEEYSSKYKFVTTIFEPDFGPADGLNKGLIVAEGEYIGILNSDDFYNEKAINLLLKFLKRNSGFDLVYGYGVLLEHDEMKPIHVGRLKLRNFALNRQQIFHPSIFVKKSFIQNHAIKFNTGNRTCWDAEFILQVLICGAKIKRLPYHFATFRLHKDSISGSGKNNREYKKDIENIANLASSLHAIRFEKLWTTVHSNFVYKMLKLTFMKVQKTYYSIFNNYWKPF